MSSHTETALRAVAQEIDSGEVRYLDVAPLELLHERVVSAAHEIPFYRHLYRSFLPVPDAAGDEFLEWFACLPAVTKSQLQTAGFDALRNPRYPLSDLIRKPTSGSTGLPFVLYLDRTVIDLRKWRFQRPHREMTDELPSKLVFIFPWDFIARTPRQNSINAKLARPSADRQERGDGEPQPAGGNGSPPLASPVMAASHSFAKRRRGKRTAAQAESAVERPDPLQDEIEVEPDLPVTVNSSLSPPQLFETLEALHPVTLIGFASSIAEIARWMLGEKRRLPSVRHIWTTSEVLSPKGADDIRAAFGCQPLTIYASNEFGFMAWEPRQGEPLVYDSDRVHVEWMRLDGSGHAAEGELGRLIITDLLNDTMPLIRYDIGDLARKSAEVTTKEGRRHAAMVDLQGKEADLLQDREGRPVTTFQILGTIKDHLPSAQYRFLCIAPSTYVLQYRPGMGFVPDNLPSAVNALKKILGADVKIVCQEVTAIEREPSGKLRPLVNLTQVRGAARLRLAATLGVVDLLDGALRDTASELVSNVLTHVLRSTSRRGALPHETELYADLAVDSLRFLQIVSELEKQLESPISDEDLLDMDIITVGDLVSFVETKMRNETSNTRETVSQ
ncbi:MAG TPA: phosphopantetheine-binding protein [Thermoanaerobaculia bacterium]